MPHSYLTDAARRRARKTGGSYQKALQALTRFDEPRPEQPLTPAGLDWSPLYGVEVTFANGDRQLRGVVLPPDEVRPAADVLRVAVTDPHSGGLAPAEVTYLDVRYWRVDPMPGNVEQRFRPSRRKTRGPRGLPLYRYDNLPAAALATKTMLARQYRMRPAEDQQPVAEYLGGGKGGEYYPLYAIDDAAGLREQTAEQAAEWTAARTCARCGTQQPDPFSPNRFGDYLCWTCHPLYAREWWTRNLVRARELATEWARGVLAETTAVIAAAAGIPYTRLVVLDVATGDVLHDLTTVLRGHDRAHRVVWQIEDDDPRWIASTPAAEVAEVVAGLSGRRIVSWDEGPSMVEAQLVKAELLRSSDDDPTPRTWDVDARRWYACWLGVHTHESVTGLGSLNNTLSLRGLARDVRGDDDPAGFGRFGSAERLRIQTAADLDALRAMAAGPPTPQRLDEARAQPTFAAEVSMSCDQLRQLIAPAQDTSRT